MANQIVSITPGTGTNIQTFENTVAGSVVEAQAVSLVDALGVSIATAANPLEIHDSDTAVAGTITTTDLVVTAPAGDGTFRTGTSTAASYVVVKCPGGDSAWAASITGTWTGTLYFEESVDSTTGIDGNWINVNGRQTGVVNTVLMGSTTTVGMFRGNTSGSVYWRIRAVGTWTGTASIRTNLSAGTGAVFLNASVPAGTNSIGGIQAAQNTVTVGTVTTATSQVGPVTVSGMSLVTLVISGTFTGVNAVFEGSLDNTNWYGLSGLLSNNTYATNNFFNVSTQTSGIDIPLGAAVYFRLRATAYSSGTMTVTIIGKSISYTPVAGVVPQGTVVSGAATFAYPLLTGGVDNSGNARSLVLAAKSTQGNFALATQALIDSGRTRVSIVFQGVAPATADTLLTLVKTSAGVAATGATSIGVAASKTMRITGVMFSLKANAAASAFATMTLRSNPGGATLIGSQSEMRVDVGNTAATAGAADSRMFDVSDGMEFSGTQTLGISLQAQATTNIISITLVGFEY
jgi:hypothetical protein